MWASRTGMTSTFPTKILALFAVFRAMASAHPSITQRRAILRCSNDGSFPGSNMYITPNQPMVSACLVAAQAVCNGEGRPHSMSVVKCPSKGSNLYCNATLIAPRYANDPAARAPFVPCGQPMGLSASVGSQLAKMQGELNNVCSFNV